MSYSLTRRIMTTEERLERIEKLLLIGSKQVLNVSECAMMLGISESRVRHLTSDKELPYYKQGKSVFFKKSEIEEWMLRDKVASNDEINRQATLFTTKRSTLVWNRN